MFDCWSYVRGKLSCEPSHKAVRHWPVALIVLSIPCTLVLGFVACDKFMSLVSTAVLVATLMAVTWYAYETRVLRLKQKTDAELRDHPWLNVERRGSQQEPEQDTTETREILRFCARNNGATPAYDVVAKGQWHVAADCGAAQPEGNIEQPLGIVLPNASVDFEVEVWWELVTRITVSLEVTYRTCHGGGGKFRYEYLFANPGQHVDRTEWLEFWLSDSTRFPVGSARKVSN